MIGYLGCIEKVVYRNKPWDYGGVDPSFYGLVGYFCKLFFGIIMNLRIICNIMNGLMYLKVSIFSNYLILSKNPKNTIFLSFKLEGDYLLLIILFSLE